MAFSYDASTDAGKVRLLIADTHELTAIFSDEEITAFLEFTEVDGENTVLLAAALACESLAVDAVRTLKVLQMLDLKTDGAAVARALRQQATAWREQAEKEVTFEVIEMIASPFAWTEHVNKLRASEGYY